MSDQNPVPPPSNPPVPAPTPIAASAPAPVPAPARPVPAVPVKPAAGPASPARRHFIFTWLGLAWTAFVMATGAALSTVVRFLYPNVLFEPKASFKAGKPDDYEMGKVDERWKDKYGVWVVRDSSQIYALSTICTHLGCTPSWLDGEQKFKCPCHGSGFYKTGINFEGPAPRPLERFRISLADDGQLLIDKAKKFQQEKGEWKSPESFFPV